MSGLLHLPPLPVALVLANGPLAALSAATHPKGVVIVVWVLAGFLRQRRWVAGLLLAAVALRVRRSLRTASFLVSVLAFLA